MNTANRLKIGLVFDDGLDSSDGVSQQVKTFGSWLSQQGHHVCYLVGETKLKQWQGGKVYSLASNLPVVFNGNRLSMPLLADKKSIKKVLADENFDILHVQMPYSPLLAQKIINAAPPSTAVIGTFHVVPAGNLARLGSHLLGLWQKRSLRRFDTIASVSTAAARFAKETYGIDSKVLPNVVDISRFISASPGSRGKNNSPLNIVFIGRLVKRKGCLQLLKAFEILNSRLPDVRLTVAGDGPLRKRLERFVERRGLGGSVNLLGFIDEADKPTLLAGADVACFPALYGESFGIVLIEAMAAGSKVVLGGDNPGYRTILGEHKELLVKPRDSALFADRLERLLTDRPLADKLHRWQNQRVKQYDVHVVGQELLGIYEQAIAKRNVS